MSTRELIIKRMREVRLQNGISAGVLSKSLNKTRTYIYSLESGKLITEPTIKVFEDFCEIFNLDIVEELKKINIDK